MNVAAGLPPASSPPPRITTLRIRDFRAFGGLEPYEFNLDGHNLLIYGENGAGKSSIFHALDELFSIRLSSPAEYRSRFNDLRNRFSGLPAHQGFVEVIFDDGLAPAVWSDAGHPADVNPVADARVVNAAYRKAILDYRSLLDTNYRHADGAVNLFEVCVRVLLRDYPALHNGSEERLFDLWKKMEDWARKARTRARPHLRIPEIAEVNALAASFNQALRNALTQLLPKIGPMLLDLGWSDLDVTSLGAPGVTYDNARLKTNDEFAGCIVTVGLSFHNANIPAPQTFLNEARLSALALAIYFAGRQLCVPTIQTDTPRLMVLDDVLIGLDQSNRMPVLRVLEKHFGDWQIVLLTHDRVWYEMARYYLADSPDWAALELFEKPRPDGRAMAVAGPAMTLLKPKTIDAIADNIALARKYINDGEYPAAAVHARIAFELSLKKVAERKKIPVSFKQDPRQLSTADLLDGIEAWLDQPKRAAVKLKLVAPITAVKHQRKVVLNAYSHSTPVSLTRGEVEAAVDAVEALQKAFKDHIKKTEDPPV